MYHCHTIFYLAGEQSELFDPVRELAPLEGFTHELLESRKPEQALAARADVTLADLRGADLEETAGMLAAWKKPGAHLILLVEVERAEELFERLPPEVTDIWTLPISPARWRFCLEKWQREWKDAKDLWQTSQYLEAAINSSPNLIWYKTKDGIHEKVNDSFCETVGKTKEQVQGQGHAYIWDVEQDDPACIESERAVMESGRTHISEEVIQAGGEQKVLSTYKSPLYDLDGTVMGTVGVALDVTLERAYAQEITRKNQMLEAVFTSIDCGILCHSLDGTRIISINQAALRILDYPTQEELAADGLHSVSRWVVEEDRTQLQKKLHSLKKVGDTANLDYRILHKDGSLLHIMGSFKLIEEDEEIFY